MIKNFKILFPYIFLMTLFLGCAINRTALDTADYINHGILNIAELEKHALEKYGSVTGKNFTTEEALLNELHDYIIPIYHQFLEGLMEIRPENIEIRRIHVSYIRGAELIYNGFKMKMAGLQVHEVETIIQANQKI